MNKNFKSGVDDYTAFLKGLYVHIPFCVRKCRYCDFNSFPFSQEYKSAYLHTLFSEMQRYAGMKCDSVFIGGGTPTCLDAAEMEMLLKKIREVFIISKDAEFTVEANPGTVDAEKAEVMLNGGVNRVSVGVQSFVDGELAALGRIHSAAQAEDAVKTIKKCGIENVSVDIMSAIPSQSVQSLMYSLDRAISLGVKHISCYSLIVEPGTPFYDDFQDGRLHLPDEDTEREMYECACRMLSENGFHRYEISNFAREGYESYHNKKYWQCKEYAGVGLSAHSYINGIRFSNTDDFSDYLKGNFVGSEETLSKSDMMSEFMFMGLRMADGVSESEFQERFSCRIDDIFKKTVDKFVKMGMLIRESGKIFLSEKAVSVSNQIMCEFIL